MSKAALKQETAILQAGEDLGGGVRRLRLRCPGIAATAEPGQFVMLKTGEGCHPLLRRPFSIHGCRPGAGEVEILFKVVGEGTALLAGIQPGATVSMIGPLGNGFTLAAGGTHYLIGGGMGIAPLKFLAATLRRRQPEAAVRVLLGARNKTEIAPLAADFTAMGLTPECATDDGSLGHHGLVTELLAAHRTAGTVYCCGPRPMMRAVAASCAARSMPCQVSMETMMACGIKACLGCTIKSTTTNDKGAPYAHVCQDGPVFAAEVIAW